MKKLGKKNLDMSLTIQAYCSCNCPCSCSCIVEDMRFDAYNSTYWGQSSFRDRGASFISTGGR